MANYTKTTIGKENRIELHEKLSLTGAEISLNELPAGANVPFVHSHKENEEIYGILSGNGKAIIDGEEISLSTGDWLKIAPAAKRQFFASDISGITYICIQVKENSLEHTLPAISLAEVAISTARHTRMLHKIPEVIPCSGEIAIFPTATLIV